MSEYTDKAMIDFMVEIDILKKKLVILGEAVDFYADDDNWLEEINRNNLYTVILKDADYLFNNEQEGLRFGGKRAREAKRKIEELK